MELSRAPVPTSPVPVVIDVLNVVQFVFSVNYVTPISIRGLVPLGYSFNFLWEVVFQPRVEMRVLSFFIQL